MVFAVYCIEGRVSPQRLHQFVRQNYTWDAHVQAVEAVYDAVLEKAGLTDRR